MFNIRLSQDMNLGPRGWKAESYTTAPSTPLSYPDYTYPFSKFSVDPPFETLEKTQILNDC